MTFTATFNDRAPGQWSGQDWVVAAGDASPWAIPTEFLYDERTPVAVAWFAGQIGPGVETATREFEFEGPASRLAVWDDSGALTAAAASGSVQGHGSWVLAVRLRHEWQPQLWRIVGFIPVLQIEVWKLARCHIGSTKTRSPFGLHRRLLRRCAQPSATHATRMLAQRRPKA